MVLAILVVYEVALLLVLVLGAPWWLARMASSGRYRAGLLGRLGAVPAELRMFGASRQKTGRGIVWVHAVSVGEVLAASALVRELTEAGWAVAVSTTTQAGQELAKKRFAQCPVFYMPLDIGVVVRRYLYVLRPRLVVTMESELWPNLIHACKSAGTSLAVVNARVSDRSFPRYMRLKAAWAPLLREVSLFLAQSEETAERLIAMGVSGERVVTTGNLKYDVRASEASDITQRIASLLFKTRLIVAGSTLADEEEVLLRSWPAIHLSVPDSALLIAPRHNDRFEEVLKLLRASRYPSFRCSHLLLEREPILGGTILLLDTIGDLASTYSLADVAFVGGSLVSKGGHNPLEPAQFGVPVVIGECYENFREIVAAMREAEAICIVGQEELEGTLIGLLKDPETAHAMGERGRRVFEAQAGAATRTMAALLGLMDGGAV